MRGGLLLFALSGCAQTIRFNECNRDDDCRNGDGGQLWCTSDHICVNQLPEEKLCPETIGSDAPGALVIGVLSDHGIPSDQTMVQAVELAIGEINLRQPGASQPPIRAYLCDTASDRDQSLRAAQRAIGIYHAVALIGPNTSDGVVAVNSYIRSSGTLVISPSATAIDVSSLADDGLVWRTAPPDSLQAEVLAAKIKAAVVAQGAATKLDLVYVNTVYGQGLQVVFKAKYLGIGGPSLGLVSAFSQSSELPKVIGDIALDAPTHLLVIADTDDPEIVSLLAQPQQLATTKVYMTDAAQTQALLDRPSAVLARIRGTAPALPDGATFTNFQAAFISKYHVDPKTTAFVANAYDAAYLVALAAAATKGHLPNGHELVAGLGRLQGAGSVLPVGPASYIEALNRMVAGGVRLEGTSGPLEFNAQGDPMKGQYDYWCILTGGGAPEFSSDPQKCPAL